jgi:hypothetical protein
MWVVTARTTEDAFLKSVAFVELKLSENILVANAAIFH